MAKKKPKKQKRRRPQLPINANRAGQAKLPVAIPPDALKDILALCAQVVQAQQRVNDMVNGVLLGLCLEGDYAADLKGGQFLPVVSVEDTVEQSGE
ncbi:hypothetical protein LCGC14_0401550 [marine sediment metagenome]|uniref:Uncharacterized protein n=1 Tax=marine sediment metagenome TaxID=412755 RepID=A0A0F9TET2_9ZZZZ